MNPPYSPPLHIAIAAPADDAIETLAAEARVAGADLLLLPQGGSFCFLPDQAAAAAEAAEPSDGPTARRMSAIAAENGVAILFSYVESCSGRRHSSLQLVDAGGHSLSNYRRAHLDIRTAERTLYSPGHWLAAMPFQGRLLGLLAGFDLAFPEAARALRLAGCDVFLVAGGHDPSTEEILAPARALENGCHVALAGEVPSCIGPNGEPLGEPFFEGKLLLAKLPPACPGQATRFLSARRPRLYQRLIAVDEAVER
jgi:predicted amidohydrolase